MSIFAAVQEAAAQALIGPADCIDELVSAYQVRRDAFVQSARDHGLDVPAPDGSFFCWVPIPNGMDSVAFAEALLAKAHVAVAPGAGFGHHGEGYVRVGLLAPPDRLAEAARRMAAFVRQT
ncbi:hypothetical protein GCM10025858_31440 [Alicyclobacillus sacchari]|nr:hypothetical protein GCM10025858_31440 [Alicyclobacillus sacchari]